MSSKRPYNTLFLLASVDGKISTGPGNERDFDRDLPDVIGVKEGLLQYYKLEEKTDTYSLNSGKVLAKVGWNEPKSHIDPVPVTFVVIDRRPHLTDRGVRNLLQRGEKVVIATTSNEHPAREIKDSRLEVKYYKKVINFSELFEDLVDRGIDRLTIQTGGELNAFLLRNKMIDRVSIVVAPLIVGGRTTPSIVDGEDLISVSDLQRLCVLKLAEATTLDNSYVRLDYEVTEP